MIFDDKCYMCRNFASVVRGCTKTGSIKTIPLNGESSSAYFEIVTFEEMKDTMHVIDENKNVYKGWDAVEKICDIFPVIRNFSGIYKSGSGKRGGRALYKIASKIREKTCRSCGGKKRR
ncbi:MAG: thiol-disulfide oxidoreductase DCC family protein [Fibrobacterota bacterium]